MNAGKPITIVGGGLAGLTLGIALRQRGVPVTLIEAGHYPRHRVCGEFISGRGLASLERLGLMERMRAAGACVAETAAFYSLRRATPVKRLPEPAWCISRFILDELLARELTRLGGELRTGERTHEREYGEGIVRATGRRVQAREEGWRWFGLKAHARGVELAADLEMHLLPDGYVGLCRLAGGEVNVCGLFRSRVALPESPHLKPEFLGGPSGSSLQLRLAGAEFDPASLCSVAGLSLRAVAAETRTEFSVGDAITMIPPVTGNGMSMAFESAELAAGPLADFSHGKRSWAAAQTRFSELCAASFRGRLRWAGWLQRAMFSPGLQSALLIAAPRVDWLWRSLFARTR